MKDESGTIRSCYHFVPEVMDEALPSTVERDYAVYLLLENYPFLLQCYKCKKDVISWTKTQSVHLLQK